jgi:hypothetical protein
MKTVSLEVWPGQGGMVQVVGSSAAAKAAVRVLEEFACPVTGFSVTGSRSEKITTYRVAREHWRPVSARLRNLDDELQLDLFQ